MLEKKSEISKIKKFVESVRNFKTTIMSNLLKFSDWQM